MPTLYSYTVRIDDGAAPNPFHGICTLAICKPAIRRVAKVGDWVVGLGSKKAPSGDLSGKVVYAMKVSEKMSLREYDLQSAKRWPFRIPNISSTHLSDRLGDCIYDYSTKPPKQRLGVHGRINVATDLGGENVLISDHFYYFGSKAKALPPHLRKLCHQTEGHKSYANANLLKPFVIWCRTLPKGQVGWPDYIINWNARSGCNCLSRKEDEKDQIVERACS